MMRWVARLLLLVTVERRAYGPAPWVETGGPR